MLSLPSWVWDSAAFPFRVRATSQVPVNIILATPLVVRLAILFVLGALAGGAINWAAYSLAWNRRSISPWSASHPKASPRRWSDRIPIAGWLGLAREHSLHGPGFWVRPLAVEALTGFLFVGLYLWTVHFPVRVWGWQGMVPPSVEFLTGNLELVAHARFASNAILVCLMLAASLIDLDEKTIPDEITITGTLVGLALAAAYPWSLLPAAHFVIGGRVYVEYLSFASPNLVPAELVGWPPGPGLATALLCWTLWCMALLPRYWNMRRGLGIALAIFWRRLRGERLTYFVLAMWLFGVPAIAWAAHSLDFAHWCGLLTALVGMAAGGGIIWIVRQIGAVVLQKEAMGFGDVTLMAMIGAFLGWQSTLLIFFIAPFFGLVMAIIGWSLRREHEIPYGPFLCLGAATLVWKWPSLWERTADVFLLGWLVPAMIAVCFVLLAVLLWFYTLLARGLGRS